MTDLTQTQMLLQATTTGSATEGRTRGNWFEAMADAWGEALDQQAARIVDAASRLNEGVDSPSQITEVSAQALRMQFLSNSQHTSLTSVGSALETMARKQ